MTTPARTARWLATLTLILASAPDRAHAGMPVVGVSDLATLRLQAISFFLLVFLGCALAVKAIWNNLREDFPSLPHLSFKRAAALVFIWGLAFNLVLTMISGARELMTPGAWEKDGLTYRLSDETDEAERGER